MSTTPQTAKSIFMEAVEKYSPDQWGVYLDGACGGDADLRARVEDLLQSHREADSLLDQVDATVEFPRGEVGGGVSIDRYTLREQLGEGGMGVVFVAEQEKPIRRKVALKVIKPGMDSKAVIARFEAERQALAMMDHPNIAKVLDAGTTEQGRPYFVMELVKGIPITNYCDRNKLSIPDRLKLFIQVCQAIQHAHQKGVIHRDIKPSNVLVTLHDGKPVPKVIDFGVAKAVNARLTDHTIYTEHFQIVGTLLYMSPEQAELSGLDIDTRSDIYSLGVLLYELLTGTTPFQKEDLDQAGFDEKRRIIRDQDPPRASVRISSLGETATAVAEHRKTDPKRLNQVVSGDLDWIVLKSLEKDRTRRYETANDFASDIKRSLVDEPITARPPSAKYLLWKAARRYRAIVASTGVIILALVIGILLALQGQYKARKAELKSLESLKLAREEVANRALNQAAFGKLDSDLWVEEAERLDLKPDRAQFILALNEFSQGDLKQSQKHIDEALLLNRSNISALTASPILAADSGDFQRWLKVVYSEDFKARDLESPEDKMFLALGKMVVISQDEAIELAESAVGGRFSPFAFAVRARVRVWMTLMSGDKQHAEQADREMASLHTLDLSMPYSLETSLLAKMALIMLETNAAETDRLKGEADEVAKLLLANHTKYGPGRYHRALYLELVGDDLGARKEWAELHAMTGPTSWSQYCAFSLAQSTSTDEDAKAIMDALPANSNYALRTIYFDEPSEREAAVESMKVLIRDQPKGILEEVLLRPLYFAGEVTEVEKVAKSWLADSESNAFWQKWERAKLRYILGGDTAPLLKHSGASPLLKCDAYSLIGAKMLAEGRREEAREYFDAATKTKLVWWPYYQVSRFYVDRMKEDENWPDWLPSAKE